MIKGRDYKPLNEMKDKLKEAILKAFTYSLASYELQKKQHGWPSEIIDAIHVTNQRSISELKRLLQALTEPKEEGVLCKFTPLEHNKSIFNLGQCQSCYSNKVLDYPIQSPPPEAEIKTAEEYYETLDDKKPFSKLTPTGISDDLESVFEFSEAYARYCIVQLKKSDKNS